jgi:hypothetical protein
MRVIRVIVTGAIAVAAAGALASIALATVVQSLSVQVTPSRAGTKAKPKGVALRIASNTKTNDGSAPPTTSTVTFFLPKELLVFSQKFPSCTLATLNHTGPVACKKAKIGSGVARVQFGAGPQAQYENLIVSIFNGPKGKQVLFHLRGTSPVAVNRGFAGTLSNAGEQGYGKKITANIPPELQSANGVYTPLVDLNVRIKDTTTVTVKRRRTKFSYFGLAGCPVGKLLQFKSVSVYNRSSTPQPAPASTVMDTAPCSKP